MLRSYDDDFDSREESDTREDTVEMFLSYTTRVWVLINKKDLNMNGLPQSIHVLFRSSLVD